MLASQLSRNNAGARLLEQQVAGTESRVLLLPPQPCTRVPAPPLPSGSLCNSAAGFPALPERLAGPGGGLGGDGGAPLGELRGCHGEAPV